MNEEYFDCDLNVIASCQHLCARVLAIVLLTPGQAWQIIGKAFQTQKHHRESQSQGQIKRTSLESLLAQVGEA